MPKRDGIALKYEMEDTSLVGLCQIWKLQRVLCPDYGNIKRSSAQFPSLTQVRIIDLVVL